MQIKFRAWDKKINKMFYQGFVIYPENGLCEFPDGGWDLHGSTENPEDFILMQFTGLHDKHGKEIYKDDIIKYHIPDREYETHGAFDRVKLEPTIKTYSAVVKFKDGIFGIELSDNCLISLNSLTKFYDREYLIDAFDSDEWGNEEEGDLCYLLEEYGLKTEKELISYLNGVEIMGNVFENPELKEQLNENDN